MLVHLSSDFLTRAWWDLDNEIVDLPPFSFMFPKFSQDREGCLFEKKIRREQLTIWFLFKGSPRRRWGTEQLEKMRQKNAEVFLN